jgi:uncharacterized protein YjbJ (UPF0337 family)
VGGIPTSAPASPERRPTKEAAVPNADQAKGRIKQAAGDLTDDPKLRKEGLRDEQAGKAKEMIREGKDKLEDAVDSVRDKMDRDR